MQQGGVGVHSKSSRSVPKLRSIDRKIHWVQKPRSAIAGGSRTSVLDLADLVDTAQRWEVDQGL